MWEAYWRWASRDDALTIGCIGIVVVLVVAGAIAEIVKRLRLHIRQVNAAKALAAARASEDEAMRHGASPNRYEILDGKIRVFYSLDESRGKPIDQTSRTCEIASDLGALALVLWRFDPKKLNESAFLDPEKIKEFLKTVGRVARPGGFDYSPKEMRILHRAMRDPTNAEALLAAREVARHSYQHLDFTEEDVRKKAAKLPIVIERLKYVDRRRPYKDIDEPLPFAGVRLGLTIPREYTLPPDAPYYEAPPRGPSVPAFIADDERQTTYILGQTGKGKTTLMLNMFRQDVEAGKAACIIDPHGDFASRLAPRYIPRSRWDDVIYFDPIASPIGINFFQHRDEHEREVLAEDLKSFFHSLTEAAGERMHAIIVNAFPLLLRSPGATFLDLLRLVTDDDFREQIAKRYGDPELQQFWLRDYPKYPQPATREPIVSRMQRFTSNSALRTLLNSTSEFNFFDVIREKKILICNFSQQHLRGESKEILGALLITQLHLAALKQEALPEHERTLFHLYVDEFQTFRSAAFHEIISGARKFGMRLTLANQWLDQLSAETESAIRGAEARIYFRLQDEDAAHLGRSVGEYTARDLQDLDKGEAIFRPGKISETAKIRIDLPPPPGESCLAYAIARTQQLFRSRNKVEEPVRNDASVDEPHLSGPPE